MRGASYAPHVLDLAVREAPDRDAKADRDPADGPGEVERIRWVGGEERVARHGGAGGARRGDDALGLERPDRTAPHAVGGQDEPRRRADVRGGRVVQRQADTAD